MFFCFFAFFFFHSPFKSLISSLAIANSFCAFSYNCNKSVASSELFDSTSFE